MEVRIAKKDHGERVAIRQVGVDTYRVESFENPGKFYETNLRTKTCTCPASQFGYGCQKHLVLADAVDSIPNGPGAAVAVERVTELVWRIYKKNSSPVESYKILTDALYSRHATKAMRTAAIKRHAKVAA